MTTTVTFYDDFVDLDLTALNSDEIKGALVASSYTFDATNSSFTTDIAPDESTGSGYAELDSLTFARSAGSAGVTDYELSGTPTFGVMTTTDYRYLVIYDNTNDKPICCIDTGTTNSLTGQGLIVSGTLFTTTY